MDKTQRPLTQARALSPDYYTDAAIYAAEMRSLLPQSWQLIAPGSAVASPGDVIAREIGSVPIIVLRNKAGELRGFFNVCPHRAGPLATCDHNSAARLRCAYHGWAYDLDGALTSAPEMREAEGFDPKDIRLTAIDVKIWRGMVFARAQQTEGPSAHIDFDALTGGMDTIIGGHLSGLTHHIQETYDVACNWKVYVDNYLEGYHLPFVHPGLTDVVDYGDYETELGRYWSLQRSPIDGAAGPYTGGDALYFFIFPNIMLNILPGRLQTNRVIPTGIDSCRIEFDYYYAPGAETDIDKDRAFSAEVQEEDRIICEHVQKGLTSGVYQPGRLSPKREAGVWHWQNLVRGWGEESF